MLWLGTVNWQLSAMVVAAEVPQCGAQSAILAYCGCTLWLQTVVAGLSLHLCILWVHGCILWLEHSQPSLHAVVAYCGCHSASSAGCYASNWHFIRGSAADMSAVRAASANSSVITETMEMKCSYY